MKLHMGLLECDVGEIFELPVWRERRRGRGCTRVPNREARWRVMQGFG